jgi:hypothetical protein
MYCRGNPIKYSDPSGYEPQPPCDRNPNWESTEYEREKTREGLKTLWNAAQFVLPFEATLADEPVEIHHLYPKELKDKYPKGIDNEAPENKIPLSKSKHRLKSGPDAPGIHTGPDNYNKNVRDFAKANPNASKEAWETFIKFLRKKFKI